jgi:MFS family permease
LETAHTSDPRLITRAFVLAALATLALNLSTFLFIHFPGYLQQLGAEEGEIGRIMATQPLGAILAWPFAGRAMDLYGRRVVILAGCSLFVVVIALYLSIASLGPFIYVVRLLDGVATTTWYAALFTHAADLVPARRRTQGLAIFGVSGLVTIGLGAQFGDVILAYANYRALFLGALGFAVLGWVLCWSLRDVQLAHADGGRPSRGIFAAAMQPNLVPVWCAAFAFFVALGALFFFLKTFVASINVGTVGGFFTAYAVIAVALRLFMGWLPDRLGTRRMLGIAMLCYSLGFAVLAFAGSPMHVLAAGLLCGAGHGYTYPVLFSLVVERAALRERGAAMAFYTAVDWLGLLVAGPVVGYAIELVDYRIAFIGIALALVAGIGLFYRLDRPAAPAAESG